MAQKNTSSSARTMLAKKQSIVRAMLARKNGAWTCLSLVVSASEENLKCNRGESKCPKSLQGGRRNLKPTMRRRHKDDNQRSNNYRPKATFKRLASLVS